MNVDKALANLLVLWISEGGDTGRRRVEHRSYLQLRFTHNVDTGHLGSDPNLSLIEYHTIMNISHETLCISQRILESMLGE